MAVTLGVVLGDDDTVFVAVDVAVTERLDEMVTVGDVVALAERDVDAVLDRVVRGVVLAELIAVPDADVVAVKDTVAVAVEVAVTVGVVVLHPGFTVWRVIVKSQQPGPNQPVFSEVLVFVYGFEARSMQRPFLVLQPQPSIMQSLLQVMASQKLGVLVGVLVAVDVGVLVAVDVGVVVKQKKVWRL